jgi:hypothetical protein
MMVSAVGQKGSTHLADAGERCLSCQRHGRRQWCAALELCGLKLPARGLIESPLRAGAAFWPPQIRLAIW